MSTAGTSSRPGSTINSPPPETTGITLVDHTKTEPAPQQEGSREQPSRTESRHDLSDQPSIERTISRKWTRTSLHHARTHRKYRRYQEDRIVHKTDESENAQTTVKGRRERGKTMVKDLWRGKKIKQTQEEDAIIEVLYENQRGFFTIGVPHFSSKSLLNFDPKAWTNARMRGSPVNITNAQVPDPNWEWAWKSWYVDMSRDVDEDGWEYSFAFYGTPWHGSHPWFHSFVRRRRWLRKRVRKHTHHAHGRTAGQKHLSEAHMLTPEYFTIHPSKTRSIDETRAGSIATSNSGLRRSFTSDDDQKDASEVRDIATLLTLLKRATIDREKIVLIRSFLHNADDELFYLEEEMPHIMSLLMFQNSRRDLLKMLMDDLSAASEHREEHKSEDKGEGERESKRITYLLKATEAADKQVKKLEYWSDIRTMVREGKTATAVDGSSWDREKWSGADASGPLNNHYSDAKEPGKTSDEVKREMEILERSSTRGTEDEDTRKAKVANEMAEVREKEAKDEESVPAIASSEGEYKTAEEVPISLDKGKGKA
ncbi:hypothetical protein KVT40_006660 [Elsinoe batatas]|uniref:Peroxin/Ferlin domain-containing protein n=1 Tax=Elsinoe batatas TaxID=2601811 RepID=A0A8K0KY40_9PEZI|nr:hypothetical protein KVT40_006660 [Elsinoe batatas]